MNDLKGKSALVVGASSGVGRATLIALAAQGARVFGVARSRERLERIAREAPGEVRALAEDATHPDAAARLLREADPDLVVVCAGVHPPLAPVDEQTWEGFSAAWNTDVKIAFHLGQAAIRQPLRSGSLFLTLSSGAAISGSPLSGGYAGAKRMQWLLGDYLGRLSVERKLGIRFVTLVPKQLIVGTEIAEAASNAYADLAGISQAEFMQRFETPLLPETLADGIVKIARGETMSGDAVIGVTGRGLQALPA